MRRIGWLSVWTLCAVLAGCFDGGEVVKETDDSGGLQTEDAADAADDVSNSDGGDATDAADSAVDVGEDIADDADESDGGGCVPTTEICDGQDNDCNGEVDDGFATGACTVGVGACEASGEYVCVDDQTAECDATPGEPQDEVCSDGLDNDCDGSVDEGDAVDAPTWYADSDGDGFGDPNASTTACEKPADHVGDNTDCDDADGAAWATVQGFADQDGDGFTAGGAQTLCTDGTLPDGYVVNQNGEDCDDGDASVNPSADEVCDGVDNDCNGTADGSDAQDASVWYVDCDSDGYAADSSGSVFACSKPSVSAGCSGADDWTSTRPSGPSNTDCNDEAADAYPGQSAYFENPIVGNGTDVQKWDYNCDGSVERKHLAHNATCEGCDPSSSGFGGWTANQTLSCGQTGNYQNCHFTMQWGQLVCDNSIVSQTQSCR